MLKESLKYFFLTLVAAASLLVGTILFCRYFDVRRQAVEAAPSPVAETAVPAPSPSPSPSPSPTPAPTPLPEDADTKLRRFVEGMSVEDKLGQLVLFGFSGTRSPSDEFTELAATYHVGNFILYGANIESGDDDGGFSRCTTLTDALQAHSPAGIPPLIAIDVEGGSVVRFSWPNWPLSAQAMGQRNDPALAREQFRQIGMRLRECGVSIDLAPVLDIAEDPGATFLGSRIISGDPLVAGAIGSAVIDGLHDGGCLATAKHFPGHGGTSKDSHDVTPIIEKDAASLRSYDVLPFSAAVEAGVDFVLVNHILYPALDETDIASMSANIISGLLRGELGFTGVVMSDDFRMGGLTTRYAPGEAAVQFLLAGGDLIMCGARHDRQRAIMDGLYAAVEDGTLTEERINESVFRILQKKLLVTDWTGWKEGNGD